MKLPKAMKEILAKESPEFAFETANLYEVWARLIRNYAKRKQKKADKKKSEPFKWALPNRLNLN